MPLLPAYVPVAANSVVTSTQFNTYFNYLYNLINGGGTSSGIDTANINPAIGLNWGLVNSGTFTGNWVIATSAGITPSTGGYIKLNVGAAPNALAAGDVGSGRTATSGVYTFYSPGGALQFYLDWNIANANFISVTSSSPVALKFWPNSGTSYSTLGAAMPVYLASGAEYYTAGVNAHFLTGTTGVISTSQSFTASGAAQFSGPVGQIFGSGPFTSYCDTSGIFLYSPTGYYETSGFNPGWTVRSGSNFFGDFMIYTTSAQRSLVYLGLGS